MACTHMLQEGMELRMTPGVPGHLKQGLEDVDQDVIEGGHQLGALEYITETWNTHQSNRTLHGNMQHIHTDAQNTSLKHRPTPLNMGHCSNTDHITKTQTNTFKHGTLQQHSSYH